MNNNTISSNLFETNFDDFTINERKNELLEDNKTLNGRQIFKVNHDSVVVKLWNDKVDYQFGLVKEGICRTCCLVNWEINEHQPIITQVGTFRFGVKVGLCFDHVFESFDQSEYAKELQTFDILIPFTDSNDIHRVDITVNGLEDLLNREFAIGESEPEKPLEQESKEKLSNTLKKLENFLVKAKNEQEQKSVCKKCHKISKEIDLTNINLNRQNKSIRGFCLGCFCNYTISGGCSVVTCTLCVSKTKTCFTCMNGATGLKHELSECSLKAGLLREDPNSHSPLPPILNCDCEN